jgi:endo-alpha-1,4-polygalactosaminidase (GH114 family)
MALPLEMNVIEKPGVLLNSIEEPYWKIYSAISKEARKNRVVQKEHPYVGITEHAFNESSKLAIMINYSPEAVRTTIGLQEGWSVEKVAYGEEAILRDESYVCNIAANDALILHLRR